MITTLTLYISLAAFLAAIAIVCTNPLIRIPLAKTRKPAEEEGHTMPPLSVIVLVEDEESQADKVIKAILSQDYIAPFEVILICDEGNSHIDDFLKLNADDHRLRSTFIPRSARYVSRRKLAVTLGVRAASHEWCVLTDSKTMPAGEQWLTSLGRACQKDKNLVVGYCNFSSADKPWHRFYRLRNFAYLWREAEQGTAYCANEANLAFRKSDFIQGEGYRGNLESVHGEYDFIVNKYARPLSTAVVATEEGSMTEEVPTAKKWLQRTTCFVHSQQTMLRTPQRRLLQGVDTLFLHLATIVLVALAVLSVFVADYISLAATLVLLLAALTIRCLLTAKAVKALRVEISSWRLLPLEYGMVFHALAIRLRYARAGKYDFITHKI